MESLKKCELESINGGFAWAALLLFVKVMAGVGAALGATGSALGIYYGAYTVGKEEAYNEAKYDYYRQNNSGDGDGYSEGSARF